jgi:MFS transporter, DHA1 family, multidrug resistance protein
MQTAEERRYEDPSEPNREAEDGIVREEPNDINEKQDAQNDGPDEIQLDDDEDPMKLPVWRKWTMTVLTTSTSLSVTFGSSVFSSAIGVMSKEFNVSEIVMLLGVSLYVTGFALGPLLFGPLSERFGRKIPLFGAYALFVIFQIPVALGRNLPTIFIFRFLAGAFGSSPVVINSAAFADYWAPSDRGKATAIYSLTIYVGPTLGPIVGSFTVNSHLGWPWTAWFTMIIGATSGILAYAFVPETYRPVLIQRKAKRLGLPPPDTGAHINFAQKYLSRPIKMMMVEPMVGRLFFSSFLY